MPMNLPRLPMQIRQHAPYSMHFRGINYGEGATQYVPNASSNGRSIELLDSKNLSSRLYPYLSPRLGRSDILPSANRTAYYRFGEHTAEVLDGQLYIDGDSYCSVGDRDKQFAVVNSKLMVWPDEIMVDMEKGTAQKLGETYDLSARNPVLTETTLKADVFSGAEAGTRTARFNSGIQAPLSTIISCAFYGNNPDAVRACYVGGAWDTAQLAALAEYRIVLGVNSGTIVKGSIVMLDANGNIVTGDSTAFNASGLFGVVEDDDGYMVVYPNGFTAWREIKYRVISAVSEKLPFDETYEVGDTVTISGTMAKMMDGDVRITAIDSQTNTITFTGGRTAPAIVSVLGQDITGEKRIGLASHQDGSGIAITADKTIATGCVLVSDSASIKESSIITAYDADGKTVIGTYTAHTVSYGNDVVRFSPYAIGTGISIKRKMPKLDFICEHDNRLYGVSNEDKTIYVSSLGLPQRFWEYDSLSTDSYAVAVGSEGNFTGCIGYGSGVLFFKEDKLHKLIGSTPASYYLYDYDISGVKAGSHKSLVVLDERLYYQGTDGVYVYAGGSPSCISDAFGLRRYRNGVGGTDGTRYYIAQQDTKSGAYGLWCFDTETRLWLQEDHDRRAIGFDRKSDELAILWDDGAVTIENEDSTEQVEWSATFCEMTETVLEKKCYSRIRIRMDCDRGAYIAASISEDGGAFRPMGAIYGNGTVAEFNIVPTRCDRFRIKLDGKGKVRLMAMVRQFTIGGER